MHSALTYADRSKSALNPTGYKLLQLMESKQTNLALAADVISKQQLLDIAELLGPEIAVLKTHVDLLEDFTPDFPHQLRKVADRHRFLLFEDRKFADIGSTAKGQYKGGLYRIAEWADMITAHILPGPGIIQGLKEAGLPLGRGLLLLAQMSSEGAQINSAYTQQTLAWAEQHADFVIGFICRQKLSAHPAFIHMTPGVSLNQTGDSLGQRYLTPEQVIGKLQSDLMIVGRALYTHSSPLPEAQRYRAAGWHAYQARIESQI